MNMWEKVEVYPYKIFEELTKLAIKFEKQLKRGKGPSKPVNVPYGSNFKGVSKPPIVQPTITEAIKRFTREENGNEQAEEMVRRQCFKCRGYGHFV